MNRKLEGKIALVTGGSAGIGLGIAKELANEGAVVYVTGRGQEALDSAVAAIGHGAVGIRADASDLADIDRLYETVKRDNAGIDILVLNAGFYEFMKIGEITEYHYDRIYNTNVKGLVFAFQKSLPLLTKSASVIVIGSVAGSTGIPQMSVYSSSKAAVRSLVRGWILDTKDLGVRINVLRPGHILTPGLSGLLPDEAHAGLIAQIPLGRLGTPHDIGKAAVFLASDDSAYITGVELDVDGGVSQY
jgi:NAD(P)-dependent dehydrogenase (short-subunit alcohol dehydrogenase family)